MKTTLPFLYLLSAMSPIGYATATETIQWKLTESGKLFDLANDYSKQESKPNEVIQVLNSRDIRFTGNHVIEHVKTLWFYPNSRDIENHGAHSIYLNDKIEKMTLLAAASINNTGDITSIDPSSLQILDTDNYRSFSDSKEVVLTLPGLTGGSLSVIEYQIVRDLSKQESDWSKVFLTQHGYPSLQLDLSINWPTSKPLYWSSNSADVSCKRTDNNLHCSGSNIAAFKNDNNIYWRDHIGQVAISESPNWQQIIDTSSNAMNKALSDTTGIDELLNSILTDSSNIDEQISAIHEFVAREIRYISMSELGHTITPHTIASVIKNRYGDCKDKSMLLYELLRRIGIETYPVLVATNRTLPSELLIPSLNYFDHVVICFDYEGSEKCLDATDQDTYWQYTPAWIQNNVSLPLKENHQPSTVANNPFRWQMDINTQISFNHQGGQKEVQERKYYGEYASSMRNLLLDKNIAERDEWLTSRYHNEVSTYADPFFDIVELSEMSPELIITSKADVSPFLNTKIDLVYEENDAWLKDELTAMRLQNKHYSEHFSGLKVRSTFEYDTNGIWTITNLSPKLNFEHEYGSMSRQVELTKKGKLNIITQLNIPQQTIKPSQIEEFNAFLDLLKRESLIRFTGKLIKHRGQ